MTFKEYISLKETNQQGPPVPKYLWIETPNNIVIYKYVGGQNHDDIIKYRICKIKDDRFAIPNDGWRDFRPTDPSFGNFTRRELNELFDDSEITELMDDNDLTKQMMLEEI